MSSSKMQKAEKVEAARKVHGIADKGFTTLQDPTDAKVEILILHGLDGGPFKSFYHVEKNFYWPAHLGSHLPSARVTVYGYWAKYESGPDNTQGVLQLAEGLLSSLYNLRHDQSSPLPLVFVGHSLGGAVIKQLLVLCSYRPQYESILSWTKAIFFLATPHLGSHLLDRSTTKAGLSLMSFRNRQIPEDIQPFVQPRSNELYALNSAFVKVKGRIAIVNFYEQRKVDKRLRPHDVVVGRDSAAFQFEDAENFPVDRDHSSLVKYEDEKDYVFVELHRFLKRYLAPILADQQRSENDETLTTVPDRCLKSLGTRQVWPQRGRGSLKYDASLRWLEHENASFQQWLDGKISKFHVTGKAGSGKSTLLNALAPRLKARLREDIVVYHSFGEGMLTVVGFLRSTLHQTLCLAPSLYHYMAEHWHMAQDVESGEPYWDAELLEDAFSSVFIHGSHTMRFRIVIDALDACSDPGGADRITSFIDRLMLRGREGGLSYLFSCRQLPDSGSMAPQFRRSRGMRLEEQNRQDIQQLVEDKWEEIHLADSTYEDLKQLKEALLKKADGVFLWAKLALDRILSAVNEGSSADEIWQTLSEIPKSLSAVFSFSLSAIQREFQEESFRMLGIVLAARERLSLPEFRLIMGFSTKSFTSLAEMNRSRGIVKTDNTMARRVQSRCGGLLEVATMLSTHDLDDRSLDTVQFLHQSVKDFLLSSQEVLNLNLPHDNWLMAEGHMQLAQSCLRYLSTMEARSISTKWIEARSKAYIAKEHALLEYAVDHWREHYAEAERLGSIQVDLLEHFSDSELFGDWMRLYNSFHPKIKLPEGYNICELAVENNLSGLVRKLCDIGHLDTSSGDGFPGAYLCLAVDRGCIQIVRILLDRGVSPSDGGWTGEIPVLLACFRGHLEILRLLLAAGVELDDSMALYRQNTRFKLLTQYASPLAFAALSGNEDVIRLVLRHDPDTITHPWLRDYAVSCLVNGAKTVVSELRGDLRESAMLSKVSNLLPLFSVNSQLDHSIFLENMLPTLCAAAGYSKASLKMFIDMQDRLSIQSLSEMFSHVCQYGTREAVEYLTDTCGIDTTMEMTGNQDGNLLHSAVRNQETTVLQYLLDLGLDIDDQDLRGFSPLHTAAAQSSEDQVLILLYRSADCSLRTNQQFTPFHSALTNPILQYSDTVLSRLLERSGADVRDETLDGISAIHIAAETGHLPVVEWLYKKGADLKAIDNDRRTALHRAASSVDTGATRVIDFLVERGLDPTMIDDGGRTPLHHTFDAYGEYATVSHDADTALARVQRLIYHGAEPGAQDEQGSTLLHIAAWHRHIDLVKLLLRKGADATARNCEGLMPIDNTRDEENVDKEIRDLLLSAAAKKQCAL